MHGPDRVLVRVPATSANLGTGFDAIGVAVQIYARLTVELGRQPEGVSDSANAAVRRMVRSGVRAAFEAADAPQPRELAVDVDTDIPLARGLGASASARAAGLVAGNAMLHGALADQQLLDLGTELEGHADNIAPRALRRLPGGGDNGGLRGACRPAGRSRAQIRRLRPILHDAHPCEPRAPASLAEPR